MTRGLTTFGKGHLNHETMENGNYLATTALTTMGVAGTLKGDLSRVLGEHQWCRSLRRRPGVRLGIA
jgi:hypothetical protein